MKNLVFVLVCVSYFSLPALAQNQRPKGPAGLEAAMEACKAQGKPGDAAFESCMTAKGFQKPSGPPPSGARPAENSENSGSN